jgi:soluble lytic murein transglycosylase-like protein
MRSLAAALALVAVGLTSQAAPDAGPPAYRLADKAPPHLDSPPFPPEPASEVHPPEPEPAKIPPPKAKPRAKPKPRQAKRPVGSVEQWRGLLSKYDWPVDKMLAIMECESSGIPTQVNPSSGAIGLMQIHPPVPEAIDPEVNIRIAHHKYKTQGLAAWRACL